MTTTKPKPKRKRASKPKTTTTTRPIAAETTSFFAQALTIQGRLTLSWMMFKAAVRILIKGRALV